jgi:hypothetical protein
MPDNKVNFEKLINTTTDAFNAKSESLEDETGLETPKMVNNRQSVFRVPLEMIRPDRFQARLLLPLALREEFFSGKMDWRGAVEAWFSMSERDQARAG